MIKIREDGHPFTYEEHLYMPDYMGRKGIELLQESGIDFIPRHPIAPAEYGICKNGAQVHGVPYDRSVLQTWEPPGNIAHLEAQHVRSRFMNYLSCVASPDNPHHYTFPRGYNLIDRFFWEPRSRLACMISRDRKTLPGHEETDLYDFRRKIVREVTEFLSPDEFHLYGRWPTSSWYKGELYSSNDLGGFGLECPVNRGGNLKLDGRYETLPLYHYNICTENSRHPGYVTEKIFHAMAAGCIPVYLGATEVDKMIPPHLYLDLRNMSLADAIGIMKSWTQADRDIMKKNIFEWLTKGDGAWWWSSVRGAKKLLWAIGKGEPCR